MDRSNILDREFTIMIIKKILTGLEERMENINETLDTEIKNQIKNLISETKNILDGINRLSEGEEEINDLEDRVKESKLSKGEQSKLRKLRIVFGHLVAASR